MENNAFSSLGEHDMQHRIVIVGTSCSGKTTLSKKIGERLNIKHVNLDSIHWLPNWKERNTDEFRAITQNELEEAHNWVCDGNYTNTRDIVWKNATHIIWLNYPFWFVMFRALKRTFRRVFLREEFVNGNYEGFRHAFMSKESILWWIVKTYGKNRKRYPALLGEAEKRGVRIVIARNSLEAEEFLQSLNERL